MIDFTIENTSNNMTIVHLKGELDRWSGKYFLNCLKDLMVEGHRTIVVEFQGLLKMSSICLSQFVLATKRLRILGGRILLVGINAPLMRLVETLKVGWMFGIYSDIDVAMPKQRIQPKMRALQSASLNSLDYYKLN